MFWIDESFSETHFGSGVICVFCNYDVKDYKEDLFHYHDIVYPEEIKRSVKKRQAEFLAGRYCAKRALAKLGIGVCDIPVGKHREPLWPISVVGSISHDAKSACAIVALSRDIQFIGVDIEPIVTEGSMKAISELVVSDYEKSVIKETDLNYQKAITLIFSAKESVFKALYPYVGDYFDFSAARCLYIKGSSDKCVGTVYMEITQRLSKQILQHMKINVRYVVNGERVITWIHC